MKYFCYDTALNEEYTLIQLMQHYPKYTNIFEGTDDKDIWDAAPWLFQLNSNPYELKGQPLIQMERCIVFETKEILKNVLDFLQSKIYIKENGQDKFFRIWDAGVLLKHLPAWSPQNIQDFFQVFDAFYTEAEDDELFLNKWTWAGGNKLHKVHILKSEALPLIKTEEELDKEYEASVNPKKNSSEESVVKTKDDVTEENSTEQEGDKPKRRKFFMD
ncbi:MAG: DUF4123 domain-containing protein [Niabella sp.]